MNQFLRFAKPSVMKKILLTSKAIFKIPHNERWIDDKAILSSWSERSTLAAPLVNPNLNTLEFGSGINNMKALLKRPTNFFTSDIVCREGTDFVIDLNKPILIDSKFNSFLALGVLEYIKNLHLVIEKISPQAKEIIFTYCYYHGKPIERLRRSWNGWLNHYTIEEITQIFEINGFYLFFSCDIHESDTFPQKLFHFVK